jgi:hypothetical protein
MTKYKKIFIPGWIDTVKNRVDFDGIDIWKKSFDLNQKVNTEYLIGHSAGANWALLVWQNNREAKLILVNPVIPKRNIFSWFYRMIKFWIFEGTKISRERMKCFRYFFSSIPKIIKLLKVDLMPIIFEMPKENLIIIKGKHDDFIFDSKISNELKSKNINVIEIKEVGHNWSKKMEEEINRIIK